MQLRELGQHPVSEASPAGEDPRQCPEYERLLEEIGKLGSLQGAAAVDWSVVTSSAAAVLEKRAKDIPAAVYLSVGLAQTGGLPGMADGLRVLADILSRWWDVCFPPLKRLRARANMLVWWRERLAPLLEAVETPVPAALRDDLLASLDEIDAVMGERLPDLPSLRELREQVRHLAVMDDAAQPDAPPAQAAAPEAAPETPPDPAPPSATAHVAPPAAATPPGDAQEALTQFLAAARACTALAFAAGLPQASAAWTALYTTLWGRIDALPPAENGITALPPPPAEELAACQSLLHAGRGAEAAAALARLLPACPFCLDAQYLLFAALTACARLQDAARVRRECRALAERLPGLTELCFADGRPLADADTRQWLRTADAADAAGAPPAASPADDVTARARGAAAEGRLGNALDLLDAARREHGPGSAEAFRLRLEQVRLLLTAGHAAAAAPLAAELEAALERHALADWQGDLCLEALRTCHTVWAALETPQARQRAEELAAAICRLRPSLSPLL